MTDSSVTRTIDCAQCSMFASDHCGDCVVTFLCSEEPRPTAVVFDLQELRAVKLLAEAGLVPTLRHDAAS